MLNVDFSLLISYCLLFIAYCPLLILLPNTLFPTFVLKKILDKNKQPLQLTAKTLFGLEEILAAELKNLGAENIKILHRAVGFSGDKRLMYEANYKLRTALRVLKRIFSFKAVTDAELYKKVREVYWEKFFDADTTFAIDAAVSSDYFRHSQFVAQRVKDAIADQFREKYGRRPSVELENPQFRINIHIYQEVCTLSLDSSGESLHKRGYRLQMSEAPLSEVLAAGMILLTGWNGNTPLTDPMCGSGTILMEAAMIAGNIPAGIFRKNFGFMNWHDFDEKLWKGIALQPIEKVRQRKGIIHGADRSPGAIEIAKHNIQNAGFENSIDLRVSSFENYEPASNGGIVVMNPPYGERIKQEDIIGFYKMIGNTLKQKYSGYEAWILSANLEALKFVGLHPSKKYSLMNGQLECKFQRYSIYKGSKKGR